MSTSPSHFRLFDLPKELRDQVYDYHLVNNFQLPATAKHENIFYRFVPDRRSTLLLVNKQMNEEVLYLLHTKRYFLYKVEWFHRPDEEREPELFGLGAPLCRKVEGIPPVGSMRRLTVEIHLPRLAGDAWSPFSELVRQIKRLPSIPRIFFVFTHDGSARCSPFCEDSKHPDLCGENYVLFDAQHICDTIEIQRHCFLGTSGEWSYHLHPPIIGVGQIPRRRDLPQIKRVRRSGLGKDEEEDPTSSVNKIWPRW